MTNLTDIKKELDDIYNHLDSIKDRIRRIEEKEYQQYRKAVLLSANPNRRETTGVESSMPVVTRPDWAGGDK